MAQGHLRVGRGKEKNRSVSNKEDALNQSFGPTWSLEPEMPHGTPTWG